MKISLNWLSEYIKTEADLNTICSTLTNIGLEVETLEDFSSNPLDLNHFCVGEVLTLNKHPNANKLQITSVDVGEDKPLSIVCGAKNIEIGMKVAVARIGAKLYDKEGSVFVIKKSKIREIDSYGMLCSESELKIGKDNSGIVSLDKNLKVGTKLSEVFPSYQDKVIEIGLTPNRMDAMSHYGVARDLYAALTHQNINADFAKQENEFILNSNFKPLEVEILSTHLVERYMAVCLDNIKIQESPIGLQNMLKSIGINPKNNVVDVTNFVMHAFGQPLHAFDWQNVEGNKIVVRNANLEEEFTILDERVLKLREDDLVIANSKESIGLAGVMGGKKSSVTESTVSVFLEAAVFDSKSVRKSSKSHSIYSDSSFRFERGIDPNFTTIALNLAVKLLKETANAEVCSSIFDFYPIKRENAIVDFDLSYFNRLVGIEIPKQKTIEILQKLDFGILENKNNSLRLAVPTYRMDVTRPADVVEEVIRIYGYDKISIPNKISFSLSSKDSSYNKFKLQEKISLQLSGFGFSEAINSSLISEKKNNRFSTQTKVSLFNPLSQDLACLRQSLVPGLLENLSYNSKRQQSRIALFEWGKVYSENSEKNMFASIYSNQKQDHWLENRKPSVFFELKSVLESIFYQQDINFTQQIQSFTNYREALSFYVNGNEIAKMGWISDEYLSLFQVKKLEVAALEIDFDAFFQLAIQRKSTYSQLPKYPFVSRDLSLILDDSITFEEVKNCCFSAEKNFLQSVSLFDVYFGDKIENGKKSYAVSFVLQNIESTLSDLEIESSMQKISNTLITNLKAEVRK